MNRRWCVALLVVLAAPTLLSAKGLTTKIVITGPHLATPIEITDRDLLRSFTVWAGPGTGVNGVEQLDGFVADWRSGAVGERPAGLQRYEASFYVKYREPAARRPAGPARLRDLLRVGRFRRTGLCIPARQGGHVVSPEHESDLPRTRRAVVPCDERVGPGRQTTGRARRAALMGPRRQRGVAISGGPPSAAQGRLKPAPTSTGILRPAGV